MPSSTLIALISLGVVILTNFAYFVKQSVKVSDLVQWREIVDRHLIDSDRHIDPKRDDKRWLDLEKRLDKIDKKVDNLLTLERDNIKRNKGDSEDA